MGLELFGDAAAEAAFALNLYVPEVAAANLHNYFVLCNAVIPGRSTETTLKQSLTSMYEFYFINLFEWLILQYSVSRLHAKCIGYLLVFTDLDLDG